VLDSFTHYGLIQVSNSIVSNINPNFE